MLKSPIDRRTMAEQIRERLEQLLVEPDHQESTKLPSERDLASQLGISRPTLREALRRLEDEGRIVRRPGLGTFIIGDKPVVNMGLEQLTSFTEMMTRAGYKAGTSMVSIQEEELLDEEARALEVEPEGLKIVVRRVRTLNDVPANYSEHILPKAMVGNFTEADMQGSVFALVERKTGVKLAYSKTEVYGVLAGKEIGAYLEQDENVVLLVLKEIIYNDINTPIMLALSYFRPDVHRYHIVRWRPGIEHR